MKYLDHDARNKTTNATEAVDAAGNSSHGRANRATSTSLGHTHAGCERGAELEAGGRGGDRQEKGGLEHL